MKDAPENKSTYYLQHYILKKNRLVVLKKSQHKCSICGNKAVEVHHKDFSKSNHCLSNLVSVCKQCHRSVLHNKRKYVTHNRISKFRNIYGYSIDELTKLLEISRWKVIALHYKRKLKDMVENKDSSDLTRN